MALGIVLGQWSDNIFILSIVISKNLILAQENYTITEQELLSMVFAFKKFKSYLLGMKVSVHTADTILRYLLMKKDAKMRLISLVLRL